MAFPQCREPNSRCFIDPKPPSKHYVILLIVVHSAQTTNLLMRQKYHWISLRQCHGNPCPLPTGKGILHPVTGFEHIGDGQRVHRNTFILLRPLLKLGLMGIAAVLIKRLPIIRCYPTVMIDICYWVLQIFRRTTSYLCETITGFKSS